ncbi:MAG TPA: outer membrane protein assembly factor BamD [Opitutaceae bacterium]|nr:outer membrane protein assembly factor BamD [Opitutaceae bacterium]
MMSSSAFCRLVLRLVLFAFVVAAPSRLAADLVWSPETGWRVEGGVLAGLSGESGRNALEMMNKARAAEERGSERSAIKAYGKVAKKYPNSVYSPEALYRSAKLRLKRRDYVKAFTEFQTILSRYPNTPRFNDIIGEQYRIASLLVNGARGRILFGLLPGFRNREVSIGMFETILLNAPYSDYAPLALMNIAQGHQRMREPEEAIDALDRMINNYPQSLLAPDAYLRLAQAHASLVEGAYYDQESTRDAITYFEDFMILFPSDNNVAKAEKGLADMKKVLADSKMRIADFYFFKRDNYKAARVFYNEAITVYPDSEVATKARQRLAQVEEAAAKAAKAGPKKKKRFWIL